MDIEQSMELLSIVPLFRGLNERQKREIAKRLIDRKYAAGEKIIAQGSTGFGLFIVHSGSAEAHYEAGDGSVSVVNTFGPNDYFGEIALIDNGPRTASVIATEETRCLLLNPIDFTAIVTNDAEMGLLISRALASRIRRLLETMGR
ncbi:MAG: cyclic nucleotide-binding domain-containing protein [Anaerolineaceae bacterium]|nr:cyclic nucleotide-binding domain-containing protein [Anaerolineaceae bacterium]